MKHLEDQELCQFKLDFEKQLRCRREDSKFSTCGSCQSCICIYKLHDTTQWLMHAGQTLKLKFLMGVLIRCKSVGILENIGKIIQVALGKDFTYARSRQKPKVPGVSTNPIHNKTIDVKWFAREVLETWDWFSCSKYWVKTNYILGLLSLCESELLQALGNLIRVLIERERRSFQLHDSVRDVLEDNASSISESLYFFNPEDQSDLELLLNATSNPMVLDLPGDTSDQDSPKVPVDIPSNSAARKDQLDNLCPPREARWARLGALDRRGEVSEERRGGRGTETLYPEEPVLDAVPGASVNLPWVSHHQDFIRSLPVHLAKKILGLLDRATLLNCHDVSKHWRFLTVEVQREIETKRMVENQAMIMQGSSRVRTNTVYSRIREVLVPAAEGSESVVSEVKTDRGFESTYSDCTTKTVKMEEKNLFCGAYNILVLSKKEDSSRVVHYSGGQLVAVGSKDRSVRLLDVWAMRERSPAMRGHAGSVRAVYLCEDRGLVFSAGYDLSIRCWNLRTGVCTMLFHGHFGTINCLDLHGNTLVSGAKDCRVKVWDLRTGRCLPRLRFRHDGPVLSVRAQRGLVLSSCDRGVLKLWDTDSGGLLKLIDSQQGSVKCLHLDEWHILSGGADGYVTAWSTSRDHTKSLMTYRHPREVLTLTFLFLRVITGCADGKIRVFDFLTGNCLRVIISNSKQSPVLSLHIHDNNIVINTRTSVLIFQFGQEDRELSESLEGECADEAKRDPARGHPRSSTSPALPRSRAQMGFISGMVQSNWKQTEKDSISHHAHHLSTPRMHWGKSAQRRPLRPDMVRPTVGRHRSQAYSSLQPDQNAKPSPALCPGRVASSVRQRPNTTPSCSVREPVVPVKLGCSRSRGAEKNGLSQSSASKHAPSEANVSQQPWPCKQPGCSVHPNVGVCEAWGSRASPLQTQPGAKAPLLGTTKPTTTPAPSSASFLRCHPLHGYQNRPFTAGPSVGRSLMGQGLGSPRPSASTETGSKRTGVPYGMGGWKTVCKIGAFTTTAEREVDPERCTLINNPCRRPARCVAFDDTHSDPSPAQAAAAFDPFRKRSLFRLLTVEQQEEREREALREHEEASAKERRKEETERRKAWRMMAKGLPSALYRKEGQIHAPELGPGTYM